VNCPACGGSHLKSAFGCDGIEHTCLDCLAAFRDEPDQPAPIAERRPAAPAAAAAPIAKAKPLKATDRDIIKLARQQLKTLNAEIARLKKLEAQRDAIKRLLAAADAKPEGAANVRSLRSSSGR
jgi:hypothetical protein